MNDQQVHEKIDPELRRQLEQGGPVQAVFRLRAVEPSRRTPPPDTTDALARALLARTEKLSGSAPSAFNVFKNLGYFVVEADAAFVRTLAEQDEILHVSPNRRSLPSNRTPVRDR